MVKQYLVIMMKGLVTFERKFNVTTVQAARYIAEALHPTSRIVDIKEI